MNEQLDMLDKRTLIERSIELLRLTEPTALDLDPVNGFHLAFSGGKDSIVILELAKLAGVKFKAWYNQTTIDPPELVRFIKQVHPGVEWIRPARNFFKAVADSHGLPTRKNRWCCEEFKEHGGEGKVKIIGVRAAESPRRAKAWKQVTAWRGCGWCICPILQWSDADVWSFIKSLNVPYCSLYDKGFKRLGCIGCPMAGQQRRVEFKRWPGFEKAWRKAARDYFDKRTGKISRTGKKYCIDQKGFKNGDEFFEWWLSDNPSPLEDECQSLI